MTFRESTISSFIDLSISPHLSITATAPLYWLEQKGFQSWGPSMVLHPYTRAKYKEGSFRVVDQKLITACENLLKKRDDFGTDAGVLFATRLHMYLGLYGHLAQELQHLQKSADPIIRDWACYLTDLTNYVMSPYDFKASQDGETIQTPEVRYLYSFLLMNSVSFHNADENSVVEFQRILEGLNCPNGLDATVHAARSLRYRAQYFTLQKNAAELLTLHKPIGELMRQLEPRNFLQAEAARRLLFYCISKLCIFGRYREALSLAHQLSALDPYCSAALTLKGMVEERIGLRPLAVTSYQAGYALGFVEKEFCKRKIDALSKIANGSAPIPISQEIDELWSTNRSSLVRRLPEKALYGLIKRTSVFEKFPTLWTFEIDARSEQPFWYRQMSNSLEVLKEKRDLFYSSCYFQSLQVTNFRRRITLEALQEISDLDRLPDSASELSILNEPTTSEHVDLMKEGLENIKSNSQNACYLSRVFLYFGLEKDAETATNWVWSVDKWGPYESFLAYTSLLLSYRSKSDPLYFEKSKIAFGKFPEINETLRMRLILCIQSGGYFGKKNDLAKVKFWHEQGATVLQQILESPFFTEGEKHLLHSRWYRFSSFVPHLEKDLNQLSLETDLYIELAEKALETERTSYTLENMYAVFETRARIAEAIGDKQKAYDWFLKLRNEVDPRDSKVEINLGDMQQKLGNAAAALKHYERAFEKGPPLRDMALFKMAEIERANGRNWRSAFLYSRFGELRRESKVASDRLQDLFCKIASGS